jgi:transcriptional pleiotropic regulator of transition state genes
MKATGFVRKIDDVGRFTFPFELRREMGISESDSMEILTHGEYIILKKYEPFCFFCGNKANLQEYRGKSVCRECATEMFKITKWISL